MDDSTKQRSRERDLAAALAVLGLDTGASLPQIIAAWRHGARQVHPDRSDSPEAARHFAELRTAYERARAAAEEQPAPPTRPARVQPRAAVRRPNRTLRDPAPPLVAGPVVVRPWPGRAR